MNLFISWSGPRSKQIAHSLRKWFPHILHRVDPWMSDSDISLGDRWQNEVANKLESCNFGVLCITPENIKSPWLLFEAGALAKSKDISRVIPLVYDMEFEDLPSPLRVFQSTKLNMSGVYDIVLAINNEYQEKQKLADSIVESSFRHYWPDIQADINEIQEIQNDEKKYKIENPTGLIPRPDVKPANDVLEDVMEDIAKLRENYSVLSASFSESRSPSGNRDDTKFGPDEVARLMNFWDSKYSEPVIILLLASFFKDEIPWLYEILLDAYRDLKDGDLEKKFRAVARLQMIVGDSLMSNAKVRIAGSSGMSVSTFEEIQLNLEKVLAYFSRALAYEASQKNV